MTSRFLNEIYPVSEDFLHYIWKTHSFDHKNLLTTQGLPIQILDYGSHNLNAGPDFNFAKIKIGETFWFGSVEIHTLSSLWKKHGHQHDVNYNNVILHVVIAEDIPVYFENGSRISCLELKNRIPEELLKRANDLLLSQAWIPCQSNLQQIRPLIIHSWLEKLMVERLEKKTMHLMSFLQESNRNWEEVFYASIAYAFGLKVNADAFILLAKSLPIRLIQR